MGVLKVWVKRDAVGNVYEEDVCVRVIAQLCHEKAKIPLIKPTVTSGVAYKMFVLFITTNVF